MRVFLIINHIFFSFIYLVHSAPQQEPETNDQFHESNHTEVVTKNTKHVEISGLTDNTVLSSPATVKYDKETEILDHTETNETALQTDLQTVHESSGFMGKFYIAFKKPIMSFVDTPKVNLVLKNIGTCIVNGAMEIISFYFPAPLIPLIASAAGMVIPFEPVVLLRKRMPVDSYRRAFKTAVNSFMGTFERFKPSRDSEEDPYMTKRFNRRFMGSNSKGY